MNGAGAGVRPSDAAFFDMTFCSIELPVTPWGDFLDVEKRPSVNKGEHA